MGGAPYLNPYSNQIKIKFIEQQKAWKPLTVAKHKEWQKQQTLHVYATDSLRLWCRFRTLQRTGWCAEPFRSRHQTDERSKCYWPWRPRRHWGSLLSCSSSQTQTRPSASAPDGTMEILRHKSKIHGTIQNWSKTAHNGWRDIRQPQVAMRSQLSHFLADHLAHFHHRYVTLWPWPLTIDLARLVTSLVLYVVVVVVFIQSRGHKTK